MNRWGQVGWPSLLGYTALHARSQVIPRCVSVARFCWLTSCLFRDHKPLLSTRANISSLTEVVMLNSPIGQALRSAIATILVVVICCLPIYSQEFERSPQKDSTLEQLIRKYTSAADVTADHASVGKLRLIWLNWELLKALVEHYGEQQGKTVAEINLLKQKVAAKLELAHSTAFLLIVTPEEPSMIGMPAWVSSDSGKSYHPAVTLRGTGNQLQAPYRWHKILGVGEEYPGYYSHVISGCLLYKTRTSDGHRLIDQKDFSFSVELDSSALVTTKASHDAQYDLHASFYYDLMPVPLQSIVDQTIPSWNNALVQIKRRNGFSGRSYQNVPYESQPATSYAQYYSQGNAMSLSRPEILQIIGLGIAFAQFLLEVAAL